MRAHAAFRYRSPVKCRRRYCQAYNKFLVSSLTLLSDEKLEEKPNQQRRRQTKLM